MMMSAAFSGPALAGGSAVAPGMREPAGNVREWPVPTPLFTSEPAVATDGNVYIAIMRGNRIARFDPRIEVFNEWDLPRGAAPQSLTTDERGTIWYTGYGNATLGALDAVSGHVVQHRVPGGGTPNTLLFDGRDSVWLTDQLAQSVLRFDRTALRMTGYRTGGNPFGLAVDREGHLWFCQLSAGRLGRIDATTGEISDVDLGAGSRPRRVALAPDGALWVTLNGAGTIARVDPHAGRVTDVVAMPGGAGSQPFAIAVAGDGRVWVNEYRNDTVRLFDPVRGTFRSFALPSHNPGIRKMVVDAEGRLWYTGSHNGRLGVIT
jgi:virginiamycin B lyase